MSDLTPEQRVCPACGKVVLAECLPSNCSAWKEVPWPAARGGEHV